MCAGQDFIQQVIYLVLARTYFNLRIQQARRTDELFYHYALSLSQFIIGRGGTDVDSLMNQTVELLERQRTVVEGGRQSETIFHEVLLSRPVATIHGANLRNAHVALVHHQQEVFREEIQQTVWPFARLSAVEISRIVLDARTVAQLLDHLHVVFHTLLDALRLDSVAYTLEELLLLHQVVLNHADGTFLLFLRGYEEVSRINLVGFERSQTVIGHRIHLLDAVYLVVPPGYSQHVVAVSHEDVHGFSLHSEVAALQFDVVSHVEGIHQLAQEFVAVQRLSLLDFDDVFLHRHRSAHTVDA